MSVTKYIQERIDAIEAERRQTANAYAIAYDRLVAVRDALHALNKPHVEFKIKNLTVGAKLEVFYHNKPGYLFTVKTNSTGGFDVETLENLNRFQADLEAAERHIAYLWVDL